jgi:CRP/FNR family transcriptional regulator, cyclic AMP receptor protein
MSTEEEEGLAQLKQSLLNTALFAELNDEQLNRLAQIGELRSYKRSEVIFNQGDEGHHFFVICSGAVRVGQTVPGIGEEAFAVLRQGTVFGEMSVFDDAPRSADATAHERCELYGVEKEALHRLFAHNRLLACSVLEKMVQLMSRRLRQSNDKLAMLSVCAKFE